MYKVTSPLDLYIPFTKNLLTEEQSKQWEEYKNEEVNGKNDEEIRFARKDPEGTRIQRWATASGLGADDVQVRIKNGELKTIPQNYQPQNKFVLPKGETIVSEKIYTDLKKFQKKAIPQTLKLGQQKPTIMYEGFLEIEPLTDEDLESLNNKKKK